jgi:hypothetical protein
MDDEPAITRDDMQEIFGALADISSDTLRIPVLAGRSRSAGGEDQG